MIPSNFSVLQRTTRSGFLRKIIVPLIILTLEFVWLPQMQPAQAAEPNFSFSPAEETVDVGATFSVAIILDTAGYIAHGAGAKISFDPNILEAVSITPGKIFGDYPSASFDNVSGRINISGIVTSRLQYFRGKDAFAQATFKGMAPGSTTIRFVYEPGSTTDSNIAVTYGAGDILAEVGTLEVTVIATGLGPVGGPQEPSPTPTPEPREISFFSRLLEYLGLSTPERPSETRGGRPLSTTLDPRAPLPSQPPITDPSQDQPASAAPRAQPPLVKAMMVILAIVGVGLGTLLGKRLLRRWKEKKRKPVDSASEAEQPLPEKPLE